MTTREELITIVEVEVEATAVEPSSKVEVEAEVDPIVSIVGKTTTLSLTTQ
jgi:hypothetical protein